jgi:hypothetical protein
MKVPYVKKPCKECPFRKNTAFALGKKRACEILDSKSFVCHKNTKLQCAGHMLIKEERNRFVSLAKTFGIDLTLNGKELVFEDEQKCINHHARRE